MVNVKVQVLQVMVLVLVLLVLVLGAVIMNDMIRMLDKVGEQTPMT